jgi:hypothetical protein
VVAPAPAGGMSGTGVTPTPVGYGVISPAGVTHRHGLPALIQAVCAPARCGTARFCGYGAGPSSGPTPAPSTVSSTGRKSSPERPVGSRLMNLIRTGRPRLALISGPRCQGRSGGARVLCPDGSVPRLSWR